MMHLLFRRLQESQGRSFLVQPLVGGLLGKFDTLLLPPEGGFEAMNTSNLVLNIPELRSIEALK